MAGAAGGGRSARGRRPRRSPTGTPRPGSPPATSNVALKPITVDGLPFARRALGKKPDPLDDADDSKPYALAQAMPPKVRIKLGGKPAGRLTIFWRTLLGGPEAHCAG